LADWLAHGVEPITMAVNLSAVQFRNPDLPKLVRRIIEDYRLPPHLIELELTEGAAMTDPASAVAVMNELHGLGIRVSIDDFGTDYSSLSFLRRFQVYKLKIDQSFTRDITIDADDKAIVGAIISMAKSLGLQTIAEGVETPGQMEYLREQGCTEMQGYYYSHPLGADQFEAFVSRPAPLQ
jgi:EAL domain-containing protein (putative c-di-GMP-specific phosphodiesterase class I)